jgi:hypothetical protein
MHIEDLLIASLGKRSATVPSTRTDSREYPSGANESIDLLLPADTVRIRLD